MLEQLSPDEKKAAIEAAAELAAAITDLPAQIETMARVNLAQKFLVYDAENKKMSFMVNEYEKAWAVVTGQIEAQEPINGANNHV